MTESSHLRKTFLMEIAWAMAPTLCLCWWTKLLKIIPQLSAECCETYCARARIQSPSNVFLFFFFFLCQRCLVSSCVTGWITNWILRGGVGVPFALSPCVFFYVTSPLCPNDAFEDAAVTWAPMTASVRAGDGCHHSFEFYILFHFFSTCFMPQTPWMVYSCWSLRTTPFQACGVQPFYHCVLLHLPRGTPVSQRTPGGLRAKTQPVLLTLKIEVTAALHAPLCAQTRGPTEKYIDFGAEAQPLRLW